MKIAILGYGAEGRSAYNYYGARGYDLTVRDANPRLADQPKAGRVQTGPDYLDQLGQFDLIIRSPGLRPDKIAAANPESPDILGRVTSASNEFLARLKTKTIAITGTKGKGTTSLLSQSILEAAGLKTILAGNIGIPPLNVIDRALEADVVVCEISSYQAIDLKHSPAVGVCLNMSPDHLDWHPDYDDYLAAKARLFANQTLDNKALHPAGDRDSRQIVAAGRGRIRDYAGLGQAAWTRIVDEKIVVGSQIVANVADIKLPGVHNRQNVCAAIAACYDFLPKAEIEVIIAAGLRACTGFPSRLETIGRIKGITYINDSAATTPEATIAAIATTPGPKILIAGGHDKGADISRLAARIGGGQVKHLIAIGDTGPKIAALVRTENPGIEIHLGCQTMTEIIEVAIAVAEAGDSVLLSPGNASYGLFKNSRERAQLFKNAVEQIA